MKNKLTDSNDHSADAFGWQQSALSRPRSESMKQQIWAGVKSRMDIKAELEKENGYIFTQGMPRALEMADKAFTAGRIWQTALQAERYADDRSKLVAIPEAGECDAAIRDVTYRSFSGAIGNNLYAVHWARATSNALLSRVFVFHGRHSVYAGVLPCPEGDVPRYLSRISPAEFGDIFFGPVRHELDAQATLKNLREALRCATATDDIDAMELVSYHDELHDVSQGDGLDEHEFARICKAWDISGIAECRATKPTRAWDRFWNEIWMPAVVPTLIAIAESKTKEELAGS